MLKQKDTINYEDKFYKVILRNGKSIFICKSCNKEFKQHSRFHDHNSKNCWDLKKLKSEDKQR